LIAKYWIYIIRKYTLYSETLVPIFKNSSFWSTVLLAVEASHMYIQGHWNWNSGLCRFADQIAEEYLILYL